MKSAQSIKRAFARRIALAVLSAATVGANAEGFDSSSDQNKLTDQTIVAAGNIEDYSRAIGSSDTMPPIGLPRQVVYRVAQFCFTSLEDLSGKAGLLLIDKYSTVTVATFSTSLSSIKVNSSRVTLLDCRQVLARDWENFQMNAKRLQEEIELQRKQNEAMIELLKKLQRSSKPSP